MKIEEISLNSRTKTDEVDNYLISQMIKNHIPGSAIVVIREGKIVKSTAYGVANLEWNIPTSKNTVFQLASSTKMLTGILLMRLVEQGKLSLENPLTNYLSDTPVEWNRITVRNLATHTSGLPTGVQPGNMGIAAEITGANISTAEQVVQIAAKLPMASEPNTKTEYGLIDFTVLTVVIERVTGKTFPVLLKELVLDPLGMVNTGFSNVVDANDIRIGDLVPKRAEIYYWQADTQKTFGFLFSVWGYSSGGLFSSTRDLAKLFIAIDRGKFLDQQTLNEMWRQTILADGSYSDFAIGWTVRFHHERLMVGHSGGPALSDIVYFPQQKLTIIVLTNQINMVPYLAQGIADLIEPLPPSVAAK